MLKTARRRPTKRENREKMPVGGRRNAKNMKKRSSAVDEMRKTQKNAHRRSTKRENHEKMLIGGRRNAKNMKKRPSAVDETQKTAKIDFRPWPKSEK